MTFQEVVGLGSQVQSWILGRSKEVSLSSLGCPSPYDLRLSASGRIAGSLSEMRKGVDGCQFFVRRGALDRKLSIVGVDEGSQQG